MYWENVRSKSRQVQTVVADAGIRRLKAKEFGPIPANVINYYWLLSRRMTWYQLRLIFMKYLLYAKHFHRHNLYLPTTP